MAKTKPPPFITPTPTMPRKNSNVGRRAWNFIRLALLWARKGGVFRGRFLSGHLRVHMPKFIKNIGTRGDRIEYTTERELTFDKTPVIHIKIHRPNSMRFLIPIPCINPPVDFDYDFTGEDEEGPYSARKSFLNGNGVEDEEQYYYEYNEEEIHGEADGEVDLKAEEFIAQFYAQMKLQRQISYLEYKDASIKNKSSN